MEKLGVVTEEEKTKTASDRPTCPKCGKQLQWDPHRNGPWCENCGTEPFEKRPPTKE